MAQSLEEIKEAVEFLNLDAVQVGRYAEDDLIIGLAGIPLLQEWVLSDWEELPAFIRHCKATKEWVDVYLLNLEKNKLDWKELRDNDALFEQFQHLCKDEAVLISLDIDPLDLEVFVKKFDPYGLSLQGGEEEKVGLKSFDDLDAIFEQLEDLDLIDY